MLQEQSITTAVATWAAGISAVLVAIGQVAGTLLKGYMTGKKEIAEVVAATELKDCEEELATAHAKILVLEKHSK